MTIRFKAHPARVAILASILTIGFAFSGTSVSAEEQSWVRAVQVKLAGSAYKEERLCHRHCQKGRVVVSFVVARDGQVSGVQVAESSGSEKLDERAIRAVRGAAPFPIMPPEVTGGTRSITAPLRFQ